MNWTGLIIAIGLGVLVYLAIDWVGDSRNRRARRVMNYRISRMRKETDRAQEVGKARHREWTRRNREQQHSFWREEAQTRKSRRA